MVQLRTNEDEGKVFRAHAVHTVSQGLCENLINALRLLANQQRDGDSPLQNIVTSLRERRREGIMNVLRSFIDLDKHKAVEVGHLRRGLRLFKVQKPKISEDHSEFFTEGADDLTPGAEEVESTQQC